MFEEINKNKQGKRKEKIMKDDYSLGWLIGLLIGPVVVLLCFAGGFRLGEKNWGIENVQSGYVVPADVKLSLEDLDRDKKSEKETIIEYKGNKFLWKVDKDDVPYLTPYEVKVIQKNERVEKIKKQE